MDARKHTTARTRSRRLLPTVAIVLLASLCLGATDDDPPIVLTNRDVDRLSESDRAQRGKGQFIQAPAPRAPEVSDRSRADAPDAGPDAGPDASDARPASYNERAGSWQEEYYRLKAIALKRALERGETIHFGDEAPPAAVAPGATQEAQAEHGPPSCVYHSDGRLLHAPDGVDCRSDRNVSASPAANATASQGSRHETCMYGIRGEVLYKPAGRSCD